MKNQSSSFLLDLISNYPDLEVLPLVHEDAGSGDYTYSVAVFGTSFVDSYVNGGDYTNIGLCEERLYLMSKDMDDMYELILDNNGQESTEEEIQGIIDGLGWKKAIFVRIEAY